MSDQGISPELGIEPFKQQNQSESKSKNFQPHATWHDKFKELSLKGVVDEVKDGTVNSSIWQQVRYGEGTKGKDNQDI